METNVITVREKHSLRKQFVKILKRHEIIRYAAQVEVIEWEDEDGFDRVGFGVLTTYKQCVSYQSLISIEEETGYGVYHIAPAHEGHMQIIFRRFPLKWRRTLDICDCEDCRGAKANE